MADGFNVEMKPIDWVKPYAQNAKLHPAEQIERLAKTIKKFGWDQPIVTDEHGVIIKGHGRRLAAIHLGMTQVPVLVRADLSKAEANAARIADNAAFSMAYDTKTMQAEISRIMAEIPDLNLDDLALTQKDQDFMTKLLDETAAAGSLIEDHIAEGERAKKEADEAVDAADAEEIPLAKVFGFGKATRAEQRVFAQFQAVAGDRFPGDEKTALFSLMREVVATS